MRLIAHPLASCEKCRGTNPTPYRYDGARIGPFSHLWGRGARAPARVSQALTCETDLPLVGSVACFRLRVRAAPASHPRGRRVAWYCRRLDRSLPMQANLSELRVETLQRSRSTKRSERFIVTGRLVVSSQYIAMASQREPRACCSSERASRAQAAMVDLSAARLSTGQYGLVVTDRVVDKRGASQRLRFDDRAPNGPMATTCYDR